MKYLVLLSKILFSSIFIVLVFPIIAQTGPGGIGTDDGMSNLQVWLKPDGFLDNGGDQASNGETVETWLNVSGYGNNATTDIGGANNFLGATLDSTVAFFNGHPAVEFDGDFPGKDGFFVDDINDDPSEATVFVVLAGGDFVNNVGVLVAHPDGQANSTATGNKSIGVWVQGDRTLWGRFIQSNGTQRSFSNAAGIDVVSNDPLILVNHADGVSTLSQYANGAISGGTISYDGTLQEYVDLKIGRQADEEFDGWISEVIVFNSGLNDAERVIVDNYLASKFGISDLTNDLYVFDESHSYDVAGIGQLGTDSHLSAFSDNIFGVSAPSALADGDWLLTGHDGADASTWTTDEQINGDANLERIAREWRLDVTNDPGTVTLTINPTDLPAFNAGFGFYTLWIDSDGDFTSGATQYPLTQNGGNFEATGVTVPDGAFVTIAAYRPEINFTQTAFAGLENVTPAVFEINIDYAVDAAISVDYTSGGDYESLPAGGTFSIDAGNTTTNLSHPIATDGDFESDENIVLTLTDATQTAGVLGASNASTYTVYDDGAAASNIIQFDAPFSYNFMKPITISSAMVSGSTDLADFPVMIRIDGADLTEIEGNTIRGDAFDIRFTLKNSVQWLEHQIERYDAGNEYIAWVKIPSLSATIDTELDMYYGNASVTTDPSVNTVFTSDYETVYHLEDATDASDNENNGTLNGNAAITTDGYIGNGLTLDGNNDYFLNSDDASLVMNPTDAFSISLWFKGTGNTAELVSRMDPGQNNRGYTFRILNSGGARLGLLIGQSFSGTPVALRATTSLSSTVVDGDWHYLVGTYDGSTNLSGINIYIDGENTTITSEGGLFNDNLSSGDNTNPNIPLSLGVRDGGGSNSNDTNGEIDEARVIRTELSADQIKTEFNNMSDAGVLITSGSSVATSGFNIAESTDMLNLTIALANIDAVNDISVDYAVTSATASTPGDYTLASGIATVTAGSLSTVVAVDLSDDAVDEMDETFTVSLSNPTSVSTVSLGANNEIELTLIDDDSGPTISVTDTLLFSNEGSTINNWSVELSGASGQSVTVDYVITALTATAGADFIASDGTLTIPVDSTSASVSFNIIDDETIEVAETFAIKLSNPINAVLDATYDTLTVTINDNDNFGIDGPGGVGDADGSGTLVMWMIADSAVATGGAVTSWENEVGISELNMTPAINSPTLVSSARNGHAEISFANINDGLTTGKLSASYFPYNEASTFVVTRHDNLVQRSNTYGTSLTLGGQNHGNPYRFSTHMPWNGQVYFDIGQCCGTDGRSQFAYDPLWTGNYTLFSYVAGESVGKTARANATQKDFDAGTDEFQNHTDYYFNLGQTDQTNFQGDILEFIMYTSPLNTAQVIITENYLAAKYNLSLDQNDYYAFETTHSNEVVGIGREDADNFHNAAKSNLLTLSNASDLDDDEYVLIGHDNSSVTTWVTTDTPSDLSNIQRVEREWRVDVTGTPGTISIALDNSKLPALPTDFEEYVLLTDDDGLFNSGSVIYPMTLVNGEYVANNINVSQGTYFTIGTHRRTIEFVGNAIQDFENVNNTISLSLSLASGSNITIPYTITGSATPGADFTFAASGSFTINAGNTLETIDLGIIDETVEESDETIIITLGAAPVGKVLGDDNVFTYTINDDDIIRSINIDHFKYSKEVTINGGQVTGSHTDFPVMISFTDNDLRTTANSGFVENNDGYDIAFYDSLNSTWVDHQLEFYDAATGEVVIWVRVPSLASGTDVVLDMFYGNSGIEFDQSSKSTWKSSYQGVWHMGEDNYDDASQNGANGVDQGAADTDGIVGRAASFDGVSNVKVSDISNLSFGVSDSYTISAWYKGTDSGSTIAGLVDDNNNTQGYDLYISNSNYIIGWQANENGDQNLIRGSAGNLAINDDNWNHIVVTYDGSTGIAYRNGANVMGSQDGTIGGTLSPNVSFTIGSRSSGAALARAITGSIDEVRVLSEALSADWITTEYTNQSNPGTFITIDATQVTNEALTLGEDIGEVTVSVRVDPVDNSQATTFSFGDTGSGTATISDDFAITPSTISIPAGSQLGTFTFDVVNDLTDETDETIVVNINTPSSNTKLGTVSSQTYTVEDDDDVPNIGFVDVVSVANEGASVVSLTLQLNVASGNDVSVAYAVTGGGATSGSDFIALSGTTTITAGNINGTISFQPIDDAIIESPETVEITLSSPSGGTLNSGFEVHTVTIADNDDLGFEGPGGVGDVANVGGENLLKLWLIADSVTASGGSVASWDNLIQNVSIDYDMIPATGTAPDVVDAAVNGHKEISFNNVSDALVSEGTLSAASFPGNEMSFFIVTETDNLNQDSYAYAAANNAAGKIDGNSIWASIPNGFGDLVLNIDGDSSTTTYETGWAGNHSIFSHIVSSDTFLVYRNNTTLVNRNDANGAFTGHTAFNFYLGKSGAASNFQGDIAEVIMFSRDVNAAQTNIINNYLAAKYDLAIADDLYNFEVSHGVEVAGIGRFDAENQHVAARAGIVTISNADDLDDGEYVLFGHDNGGISSWITAEVPSAGISRTAREWRFGNTGSPGTITISISSDLLPALPEGDEDYVIMQDADGDFSSGATVINTVFVDGQYKASDLSIASGDYVTFGIAKRTISFASTTGSGSETVAASATLNLSLENSTNITLDYEVTGGTATGGSADYSLAASGQVTFIAGQTSISLPLGIINDLELESSETIEVTLSNPPAGVSLTDSVFTYTINDDDNTRNIQFNIATSSADESVSSVSLQVDLNSADAMNDTEVDYAITGGTAEASPSPDFTFTAGTLVIAATETTGTIDFTILDDVLSEGTETIIVTLSSPVNANLGTNVTHTYSITDNDGSVTVEFQGVSTTIDEGGSIAGLVVELSSTSGQDVEVDYTVSGVTALGSGVDFSLADGTLVIPAGSQLATINVALTDDGIEESAETLTVTLSDEVGATLGTQTVHTVTISDNDAAFGYYGPGGVGDAESNMLWLDAEAVNGKGVANVSDGASVTTWFDRSGNTNDFTAIGTAPAFDEDAFNLKNTVIVSSSNQGFQAPMGFSNALSNYSFLSVMSQASGDYLVETNTPATGDFRLGQGIAGLYGIDGSDHLINQSTSNDITTWRFNSESSPTSAEVFRNGAALASDDNYQVMAIDDNFALGSRNAEATQGTSDFAGNISEFIMYRNVINDAQRVIIENYLANKYDLTIPNDLYAYEGTYGKDIVGIGRTNDEQHLQAMSDSLLMISGASDLQNDEYVFAGHDIGSDLSWTTLEAPNGGSNVRRLAREWRTDITGAPGTIIIKIDTTQLPTPPSGYDQYVVYTDEDGDFRSGATTYQVEYSAVFGFHVTSEVVITDGTFITIGVGQPVIEFSVSSSNGDENLTNPSIEVGLNFTLGEDATVNYAATGGSATGSNVDYLLASGTLTIAAGQSNANISLGIIDDILEESDETVEITLTTPSSNVSLGSSTVYTYTIHDDDNVEGRTIDFSAASGPAGDEATPSVTSVSVELNLADNDVATTVDLTIVSAASDAADLGDDFTLSTSTLTFPADGSTVAQSFDISVVDDAIFEGTEVITLQLSNPSNASLGSVTEFTMDITDNDSQPLVGFALATSFIGEGAGTGTVEVELAAVSVNDVTVDYTVTSSATAGADFTLTSGSLLMSAGELTENVILTIVDDLISEAAETITITLTGATNATVSGTTVHVITILDNDLTGNTGPGGVGDASNNLLWLRGDSLSGTTTWLDISGNDNDFTGTGFVAGGDMINGKPTVEFSGTQSMTRATALQATQSDYDIFVVTDADVSTNQVVFDNAGGVILGNEHSTGAYQDADGVWKGSEILSGTSPAIVQYNLESGAGNSAISLNGTETITTDYTSTNMSGATTLGGLSNDTERFTGELAEVIVYNNSLNEAQRILVSNYLATRYGISLAVSDLYAHDTGVGADNSFFDDLIGIGQANSNSQHVASTTENFMTISNPSDLQDGEYLMLANNGGDNTAWTFTGAPADMHARILTRQWRVDETGGDIGTISMSIDTTQLPVPPAAGLTWALVVSSDNDFSTIDTTYPLTPVSGEANIMGIDGLDLPDDAFFTFALVEYQSMGDGDFNNPATWTTGVVPTEGTNVKIADGDALFLTADAEVGSMTIENGGSLDLNGFTLEFSDGCITLVGTGMVSVMTAGSTIGYTNPNATEQCVTGMTYNNIFTDGPTGSTKFLLGDINVEGSIDWQSSGGTGAVFDAREFGTTDDYDITLQGNWTSEITFLARTGDVTFNGTSGQTINTAGGETFNNMIVNKVGTSNRADSTITLASGIATNGSLTMTSGFVNLGAFDVEVNAASSIVGGSEQSYFMADNVGVLRHAITALSTAYEFPIGDPDDYAPFTFTLNAGILSNSKVTINMRDAKHTDIVESDYITRYWSLNNENITGSYDYSVSYIYDQLDVVGSEPSLLPRKFSAAGDDIGGSVNTGANILTNTGYNSFSDFTAESQPVPLPVTLLSFTGESEEQGVLLTWKTATESDNSHFEVFRSLDGDEFSFVGTVGGNGDSDVEMTYSLRDVDAVPGLIYYSLRQIDFDGDEELIGFIAVDNNSNGVQMKVTVYPNPATADNFNLRISSLDKHTPISVKIIDLNGQLVYNEVVTDASNYDERILPINNMPKGIYLMVVKQGNNLSKGKVVIK